MAWRYIELHTTDPTFNLAVEQYVFDRLPREHSYFMLWQNAPSVIIGKHQNAYAEINADYVREKHIQVVRRLSGGGAVYHDLGNLNFTFVQDGTSSRLDLSLFCDPVAKTLRELGAPAEVNGRNDITVQGMKISGNAQYVREGRVMHHGTLLFDADLEAAAQALKPTAEKLRSKGVASVRSRMTTLSRHLPQGTTLAEFKDRFLRQLFAGQPMEPYTLNQEDLDAIEAIRAERYALPQWNFGQSPPCDLVYSGRIEGCGTVELHFRIEKGRISRSELHGDFFTNQDPAPLADAFLGCAPEYSDYAGVLAAIDPEEYIRSLSKEDFLFLLKKQQIGTCKE
ncbi:MAG: lipoate--protein ligase [Oscillospiraceae bacterium]|nr:lipoate--protein ligase [Oscillospiraceae bacterium]